MSIKLNPNGLNAWLWKSTFGSNDLPKSICPYFWGSLFTWIMLIPGWPGHVYNYFSHKAHRKSYGTRKYFAFVEGWYTGVHVVACFATGGFFFQEVLNNNTDNVLFLYLAGIGMIIALAIAMTIIFAIGFFGSEAYEYFERRAYDKRRKRTQIAKNHNEIASKPKRPSVIKEYVKGFMGKYCKKIEWTENV